MQRPYGTLPSHPSTAVANAVPATAIGEEYFGVAIDRDGVVRFELLAFSEPGTGIARMGGQSRGAFRAYCSSGWSAGIFPPLDLHVGAAKRAGFLGEAGPSFESLCEVSNRYARLPTGGRGPT